MKDESADRPEEEVPCTDGESILHGQVLTELGITALASRLAALGVQTEVRESSLYDGGVYIRVRDASSSYFTLEWVSPEEYLTHGDALTGRELAETAREVSGALGALGLKHRMELYPAPVAGREDAPFAYYHHQWPSGPSTDEE